MDLLKRSNLISGISLTTQGRIQFIESQYKYNYDIDIGKIDADVENFKCPICLGEEQKLTKDLAVIKTPCSHHFHLKCLVPWIDRTDGDEEVQCPICRYEFQSVNI